MAGSRAAKGPAIFPSNAPISLAVSAPVFLCLCPLPLSPVCLCSQILAEAQNPLASRGIAFVKFLQRDHAARAIEAMYGTTLDGFGTAGGAEQPQPLQVRLPHSQPDTAALRWRLRRSHAYEHRMKMKKEQ